MPKSTRADIAESPNIERPKQAGTATGRRLAPEEREQQIVEKAIEHFATHGFSGSTRELAREIGVTQPLLYRYFPSKDALIDRVYSEVYKWDPIWEEQIQDRSVPLLERLMGFYRSYARTILQREWIRTFIFAGLSKEGINTKYLTQLRERVFLPVLRELWTEYGVVAPTTAAGLELHIELIWSLHASIFYIGVRKWVYGLPVSEDIDSIVGRQVDTFLNGAAAALKKASTIEPPARREFA
ncbi:TetR/AcrR family transcriptional regulator [Paraburkholderia sp. J7]|uniref:TetR/AcrR family transcriptional regulator n=1 Tax=Paraburkholderia sp. J7 TaxID=2805438 RepID=UPI002AB5F16E|nr:TetR/AcrR family transcriptional regulator [Paraburkholderia sp. J7]